MGSRSRQGGLGRNGCIVVFCSSSVILMGGVEHLNRADNIGRFEQMPTGIRLLRAGSHGHRIYMVLWKIELPKCTKHVCWVMISKPTHIHTE